MKQIVLLIISFCLLACNQREQEKNDLQIANLKGKVKSIREIEYEAIDRLGKIEKGDSVGKSEYIYDEQGEEIEHKRYNSDGSIDIDYTQHLYPKKEIDKEGWYKSVLRNIEMYFIKRNKKKYVLEEIKKGNTIMQDTSYNPDGSISFIALNEYDQKGNLMMSKSCDPHIDFSDEKTYKYDERGKLIERKRTLKTSQGKSVRKYNDKGHEIEWNLYSPNGNLNSKHNYVYHEKGNVKKYEEMYIYNSDGSVGYKLVHSYNESGEETESSCYDSERKAHYVYEYEYDRQNNWIKRMTYVNGVPVYITERKIVYYE